MPPGRVVGSFRLRATLGARIPPYPPFLHVTQLGIGLMKGTPGNTLSVDVCVGAVGAVIVTPWTRIRYLSPVFVVSCRGQHTHVVSELSVTTTREGARRERRSTQVDGHRQVPSDTPNTVGVLVTATVTDAVVMMTTMVARLTAAAATIGRGPVTASEGVAGACRGVGLAEVVMVSMGCSREPRAMLPRLSDPDEHWHAAPRSARECCMPYGGVGARIGMAAELVQRDLHTCAKAPLPAGPGQTASRDSSACNDWPGLRAKEIGVGR